MRPPLRQGSSDDFQTPPWALTPLIGHLKANWVVWECASGQGNLATGLKRLGFRVVSSDLATGRDFLAWQPKHFDCIITNPPFRFKQQFLERCYQLGKPFALLLPLTTLETRKRQQLFERHGVEIILFDRRIDFQPPSRVVGTSSWFATAWFTSGLHIGRQLSFEKVEPDAVCGPSFY